MKKIQTIILMSALSLALLTNCSYQTDSEQEKNSLLDTDRMFAETARSEGTVEAFHQYLAEDALLLIAGGPVVRGNQTIYERMMRNDNPSVTLDWEPIEADVSADGGLGYTWGRYTVFRKDSSSTDLQAIGFGKYLNVWEKQEDGSWKVKIDIGNENPEPVGN